MAYHNKKETVSQKIDEAFGGRTDERLAKSFDTKHPYTDDAKNLKSYLRPTFMSSLFHFITSPSTTISLHLTCPKLKKVNSASSIVSFLFQVTRITASPLFSPRALLIRGEIS